MLSARNQLAALVKSVKLGNVMAEVVVDVAGTELVAVITRGSAEGSNYSQGITSKRSSSQPRYLSTSPETQVRDDRLCLAMTRSRLCLAMTRSRRGPVLGSLHSSLISTP